VATRAAVNDFLAQRTIAVVGVSRDRKKFGNVVYRLLREKGYRVLAVNPNMDEINGEPCYPEVNALPDGVDGVITVVPPAQTNQVVAEVAAQGIGRIWMQQGSESETAVQFCESHGISVIAGECILMFAKPVGFPHNLHRWVWGTLGRLPE